MKVITKSMMIATASLVLLQTGYAAQPGSQAVDSRESAGQVGYSTGEIKKIDADRGVVTLKHGPIENLGMPNMTLIFCLAQPEQLTGFKVGDRVRFKVEKIRGSLVVVELMSSR